MRTVLKIELKNITYHSMFAESAHCFFAKLYISDRFVAKVSNLGTDAINDVDPVNIRGMRLVHQAEEYLKTLSGDTGVLTDQDRNFQKRLSTFIDSWLDNHLQEKQIGRSKLSVHKVKRIKSGYYGI